MANGKPEIVDGFVQLAHELDAALDLANFGKLERMILREVKAQCFGASKRKTALVCTGHLATRYNIPRQHTNRALQSLIGAGVLKSSIPGEYTLNKYYRGWTLPDGKAHKDGNGSRFSTSELSQIASAPEIAKGQSAPISQPRKPVASSPKVTPSVISKGDATAQASSSKVTPVISEGDALSSSKMTFVTSEGDATSYIGAGASEIDTKQEFLKTEKPSEEKYASLLGGETKEDDREALVMLAQGLADSQDVNDTPKRIASIVDGWLVIHPADRIAAALEAAMVKPGIKGLWQYVAACLATAKEEADRQTRLKAEREKPYVRVEPAVPYEKQYFIRDGRKIGTYTGLDMGPDDTAEILAEHRRKTIAAAIRIKDKPNPFFMGRRVG